MFVCDRCGRNLRSARLRWDVNILCLLQEQKHSTIFNGCFISPLPNPIPMRPFSPSIIPVLIAFSACTYHGSMMSETEFGKLYMDTLSHRYPQAKFKQLDDQTIVSDFKDEQMRHFIGNAYNAYKMQPDSITSILRLYANSAGEIFHMDELVRTENVVPVIKSISYIKEVENAMAEAGASSSSSPEAIYDIYNEDL